nr:hypothetical protein [uncultured Tolumonas sp.]
MTVEKNNSDEKKEGGISVLNPEKNEFIQFQDAGIWYKYFRANYGVCLSDALMKDQDDFGNRVRKQVETELNKFDWDGLSKEFKTFKNNFQDVDLFLTDKDIKFLLDEPRFVNYCWFIFYNEENDRPRRRERLIKTDSRRYINGSEFNNNLRLNSVINCIQNTTNTKARKYKFILELRSEWSRDKFKDISWLTIDDIDNNKWIFDTLVESKVRGASVQPEDIEDYYWSTLMLLDTERNETHLNNLISKLRKSLSQRKYRAKTQELKYYSIAMSEDSKQKLDSIVRKEDTKIYKVIERLINQEFEKN